MSVLVVFVVVVVVVVAFVIVRVYLTKWSSSDCQVIVSVASSIHCGGGGASSSLLRSSVSLLVVRVGSLVI